MAAIRQRSEAKGTQSDLRGKGTKASVPVYPDPRSKVSSQSSAPAASAEGWTVPLKIARRRGARGLKVPAASPEDAAGSPGNLMKDGLGEGSVPVTVRCAGFSKGSLSLDSAVSEFQQNEALNSQIVLSKNPFAALGVVPSVAGQLGSRDVCPGPLKRARSVEYSAPRTITKKVIKKGKGCASSSKIKQVESDGPDHPSAALGLSTVTPDKSMLGEKIQSFRSSCSYSESAILDQGLGPSAIDQDPRSVEPQDSMLCTPQISKVVTHSGCLPDSAMIDDLGEGQPHLPAK